MGSESTDKISVPERLPFLESISWFDHLYHDLPPLDMLRRYESGWRNLGVLADPSPEEWSFIRELAKRFGSYLRYLDNPSSDDLQRRV
ncbi:MAG TPA: hypothetical protein VGS07_25415 [Thermoanaerobaculia bacterium]|jgi:hypothetical protein|nr:hypothetical protein [Thermoanaerobaculia bacterium]